MEKIQDKMRKIPVLFMSCIKGESILFAFIFLIKLLLLAPENIDIDAITNPKSIAEKAPIGPDIEMIWSWVVGVKCFDIKYVTKAERTNEKIKEGFII